jgi:outer membrane protein
LESQKSNTKGAYYDVEKAINDISLNVANAYLLVLSSREQIKVAEVQVFQTSKQLEITRKQYAAGTVPELNVLQLESNLTTDSSSLISAKANYDVNILTLKSFLNLDAAAPFELDTPDVDKIPVESFADLQPDVVYQLALQTQPQQKSNLVKVKGALDAIKSNKAALYPTIAAGYSLSSNFANYLRVIDPSSYVQHTPTATGLFVNYAGSSYDVLQPTYTYNYKALPLGYWFQGYNSQLGNNFTQRIGVGITVPIFNNGTTRITYENSKLNLRNLQLQSEQADYTLKQNIYTAYSNAVASFQKFTAGKKNVETTQKAYNVALRRYEIGLLGILDMITNQNNLTTAKLNLIANEYDYIFKMKLLEFYKGNGIKL